MQQVRTSARPGPARIAVLGVIALFGVPVGPTMPAVRSDRDAGRRASCGDPAEQVGLDRPAPFPEASTTPVPAAGKGKSPYRAGVGKPLLGLATSFLVQIRRTPRPTTALDIPLGVKPVSGVEESGFYNTEGARTADPFRWTDGSARLVVPFEGPAPVALHVRLGLGVPRATRLAIKANGISLFDETVKPRTEWVRNFDLRKVVTKSPVTIEIVSGVFVPSAKKDQGEDDRDLGVIVRGVTLIGSVRDFAGVNLAAEPVPGVDESGFHNRERSGDQPCRWTDGNAKVIVPVPDGRRWRSIAVKAEIPDRPNYRVRVAVNGRVLFDDVAMAGSLWAKVFPLDGIDLDRRAVIEVTSSSIAPGQATTKDGRTLGIRLRELILRGE